MPCYRPIRPRQLLHAKPFAWDAAWALPNVAVEGLRPLAGELAHQVYGGPSERLHLIGVTGTNGKTSTTQWIAQALERGGRPSAVIGTLGIGRVGVDASVDQRSNARTHNRVPASHFSFNVKHPWIITSHVIQSPYITSHM